MTTKFAWQQLAIQLGMREYRLPPIELTGSDCLVLMGGSGAGKSSLLHWLLGDKQTHVSCRDEVYLNGEPINDKSIQARRIGLLMQDVLLFEHLSVLDNLRFALPHRWRRKKPAEQQAYLLERLSQIEMAEFANAAPAQLSGGQAARIGLLRALIAEPLLMLLDEPFAALDPRLRSKIRDWTFAQLQQAEVPCIMVTHDLGDIPATAKQLNLEDYHV